MDLTLTWACQCVISSSLPRITHNTASEPFDWSSQAAHTISARWKILERVGDICFRCVVRPPPTSLAWYIQKVRGDAMLSCLTSERKSDFLSERHNMTGRERSRREKMCFLHGCLVSAVVAFGVVGVASCVNVPNNFTTFFLSSSRPSRHGLAHM